MKATSTHRAWLLLAAALGLLAGLGLHTLRAEVSVRAVLEPPQVPLGRAAQLTVEVSGASSARIALPQVEGLEIVSRGAQTSFQFIKGVASQQSYYIYVVVPYGEGQFVIPSFTVDAGGRKIATAPLSLKVTAGQAPNPPPAQSPAQPTNPPDPQPQAAAARAPTLTPKPLNVSGEVVFLRLYSPHNEMVVGQTVPVTVKLYVRADQRAELGSLHPKFLSDAFTVTLPKKFDQGQEIIDGNPYNVAEWNLAVVPVKTGDFAVGVEQAVRMAERVKSRRPQGFEDSFFDAVFQQQRLVEKNVQSIAQNWKVTSAPAQGRPENFAGAIGDFTLSAKVQPDNVKVGEPVTLEMVVEGRGNLDRVNAPALGATDAFKSYSPTSKVEARDELGTDGRKVFTGAVIPLKPATLPPITFSFYNPETKQYVTRTADAPRLVVTEAPAGAVGTTASTTADLAPTASKTSQQDKPPEPALVPIKVYLSPFVASFKPVCQDPLFIGAQLVPLSALVAGFIVARRRRRLESDPDFARAHEANRAVRAQLEAMNVAVTRNDAPAFFTAARRAVQYRLADCWRVRVDDITFDLISTRSAQLADSLKSLFLVADEMAYSGQAYSDVTLAQWQKAIVALLVRLEKKV